MIDYLIKRPMLFCGIICSVIAVVGYYFNITLLLFGIITVILISYLLVKNSNHTLIFALILVFIMILSSIFTYSRVHKAQSLKDETVKLDFVVLENTNKTFYSKAKIEMKSGGDTIKNKSAEAVYYKGNLEIGGRYCGKVKFREIDDDYKLMNYSQNIFFSGYLTEIEKIKGEEDFVLQTAEKIRSHIKETAFQYLGYNEASTLCALLLGEQSFFTDEFYSNVKGAGVSHVMVVSGMHLAIVIGFFTKILDRLMYNRFIKAFLILAMVLFLTAVCGFTMSMKRAGMTYALTAISLLFNRISTPANTLGAAVVIILISSPFTIFNVAFQLSVLSTFGILAVALPIMDYIKRKRLIKSIVLTAVLELILLSLSALILTLPVTIYIFGYVSAMSLPANLLISNVVTIILCLGVAGLLASPVSYTLTAVIMLPCYGLLKFVNWVINTLGGYKFSTVTVPIEVVPVVIFAILLLFWLLIACKKRRNVLELKEMQAKILKEGRKRVKWQ